MSSTQNTSSSKGKYLQYVKVLSNRPQRNTENKDDLSKEDVEALGGMEVLKDEQGFFVYRNDRLIIYGTWFRLSSRSVNAELYKYG